MRLRFTRTLPVLAALALVFVTTSRDAAAQLPEEQLPQLSGEQVEQEKVKFDFKNGAALQKPQLGAICIGITDSEGRTTWAPRPWEETLRVHGPVGAKVTVMPLNVAPAFRLAKPIVNELIPPAGVLEVICEAVPVGGSYWRWGGVVEKPFRIIVVHQEKTILDVIVAHGVSFRLRTTPLFRLGGKELGRPPINFMVNSPPDDEKEETVGFRSSNIQIMTYPWSTKEVLNNIIVPASSLVDVTLWAKVLLVVYGYGPLAQGSILGWVHSNFPGFQNVEWSHSKSLQILVAFPRPRFPKRDLIDPPLWNVNQIMGDSWTVHTPAFVTWGLRIKGKASGQLKAPQRLAAHVWALGMRRIAGAPRWWFIEPGWPY